jgi:xanthine dehydrogenase YagR molybdenum-binding subunit
MSEVIALTMDEPVEDSLLDHGAQGLIGKPLDRIDGPLKVAGRATYAAEYALDDLAYGVLVRAPFGRGKLSTINADVARTLPGVIDVFTDMGAFIRNPQQGGATAAPEQGVRDIRYFGEIVAIALAESYEAARDAAERVVVAYEPLPGRFDFDAHLGEAEKPKGGFIPPYGAQGDLDRAMAEAAMTIDVTYTTPSQSNAPMEPHASIACWDADGALTLYGAYQMPASDREQLADALGLPIDKVRIVSAYVGGGFGSKLGIAPESVAAALAAKKLGRPVKAVMTRQQVFDATVRRSNTRQRIRLGADRDGRLHAIGHETLTSNLPGEDFFEPAGIATHFLYAGENRRITHDIVRMDWLLSASMRAPGEAAGMLALECAMDELAEALGMDPVTLRKINDPKCDPEKGIPYSSRSLTRCLDEGARRFGWTSRSLIPGSAREGQWLIGHGMAASARSNLTAKSEARVALGRDGRLSVETDMTDIGTGTYTILAQVAGELMGLPLDRIDVRLGDNRFPPGAGSGGSWGASSSGSSVYLACAELRRRLAERMGCAPDELTLKDGVATAANRRVPIEELAGEGLEAVGRIEPGRQDEAVTQASYGAHFCEVAVDAVTGETRVRRWLSTFAAGRILNEKTATSQLVGGIVFGIGAALTEELVHDRHSGKVVNRDLAEYHLAANADVPQIEVVILPERDPHANPLQAKGIGELGISGAGAAVVNAIYNATGVRARDYPVTLDKLLPGLPPV